MTRRQRDILTFICQRIEDEGFAPITSTIAKARGISHSAVVAAVASLELQGFLTRDHTAKSSSYRTIRLTEKGQRVLGLRPKEDSKKALERILNAWDAPYTPDAWIRNLEDALNAARTS